MKKKNNSTKGTVLTDKVVSELPRTKREIQEAIEGGGCPYCGSNDIVYLGFDDIFNRVDLGCDECEVWEFSYQLDENDIHLNILE